MSQLYNEVMEARKEIYTDGYSMSIGELLGMYLDGDLDVHPEFQRRHRWSQWQKSRLIESLLIGIPIPSILVYKREDGKWDLIDGLQRLSTIFQFMGVLDITDEETGHARTAERLQLLRTTYLPSLEGKFWKAEADEEDDSDTFFSEKLRRLFRRQKIDVIIIEEENNQDAQYELFDRLNTGGSPVSVQELRNFLLLMMGKHALYNCMQELAAEKSFQESISSLDKYTYGKQGDLELVARFLVFRYASENDLLQLRNLPEFITQTLRQISHEKDEYLKAEQDIFRKTFRLLMAEGMLQDDTFRLFDAGQDQFFGNFSMTLYEIIAIGLSHHIADWRVEEADDTSEEQLEQYKEQFKKNTDALSSKILALSSNQHARELSESLDTNEANDPYIGEKLVDVIAFGKDWFRYES